MTKLFDELPACLIAALLVGAVALGAYMLNQTDNATRLAGGALAAAAILIYTKTGGFDARRSRSFNWGGGLLVLALFYGFFRL